MQVMMAKVLIPVSIFNKILFRFPNDSTKKPFDSIQFPDDPEIRQG